ncbi:hypothetical protein ACVII1_001246 [Bradyrhizobium elkanii]|uniref:Uncharacterized protein n=1 Tax=Bradyrhizobium elkanii TaxID=29448 RepID=A0A8I2C7C1_BRAEL|nr:hypothetical protein [Bradyrhizobium elkanii]
MAPKRCVPKKWQQVQRIANRSDVVLVTNMPRCLTKAGWNGAVAGLDQLKAEGGTRTGS